MCVAILASQHRLSGDSYGQTFTTGRQAPDMMSYSRAWPTTSGMPAAAGPIAPSAQVLSGTTVPNNGPNVGNVQPVMCQPVQPFQRQNKDT